MDTDINVVWEILDKIQQENLKGRSQEEYEDSAVHDQADYVSFGEFATVLWELEKHKSNMVLSGTMRDDEPIGNQENGIVNLKINK